MINKSEELVEPRIGMRLSQFWGNFGLLSLIVIAVFLAEHINHLAIHSDFKGPSIIYPIVFLSLYLLLLRKKLSDTIGTSTLIFSSLILLSIATLLASLLLQFDIQPAKYGRTISRVYNSLHFDDIINSWWYASIFVVIGVSLGRRLFMRVPGFSNLIFHLTHLSMIIMIIGFFVSIIGGWRGKVTFESGDINNKIKFYEGNTMKLKGTMELPFHLKLNDYSSKLAPVNFRLQLLKQAVEKNNPHTGMPFDGSLEQGEPELVSSFPLIEDKIYKLPGTDMSFRLNQFYPNFGFKYDYPIMTDTITPIDPGIMVELIIGDQRAQLQLRANENSSLDDPHMGALIEFYWEYPEDLLEFGVQSEEDQITTNPERIVFVGDSEEVVYVFPKMIMREKLERTKEYHFPNNEDLGFKFQFIFPDAKYITANPSSLTDKLINPVAKLEIWGKDWDRSAFAYVYPGKQGVGSYYQIAGTDLQLGLGKQVKNESRYFQSNFSILNQDLTVLRRKDIGKNLTVSHGLYLFNQIHSNAADSDYPGLQIRYIKGLYLIYAGILGLVAMGLLMVIGPKRFSGA